ncbi:phosphodiester glycosidase family protein [Nonomuraea typhae]|uniref:Phosphodiester glycosidase family protein n=1 Tax=Nonomuraea typhae TaxID=2603600 RepID=A0ABW7ZC02_9ACTN
MSRRALVAGLSLATAITATTMPVAAKELATTFPSTKFPLGTPAVPTKTQKAVGQGIDLYNVRAGSATQGYSVTVLMPSGRDYGKRETADAKAAEVEAAGQTPSVQQMTRPGVADSPAQEIFMVRVGLWSLQDKKKAEETVKALKDAGIKAKVDYLGDDGVETTGPWDMSVLMIDAKKFAGSYGASLGTSVAKRETTSAMAKTAGALAAINGGFFNIHASQALRGDPLGASVVAGKLLSEPVAGRAAIVLRGRKATITELKSTITARSQDGQRLPVNGVNRPAAVDELVLYTEEWGAKTPAVEGADAVLDANGKVVALRTPGAAVPAGQRVLHGTGVAADWLREHALEAGTVQVDTKLIDVRSGRRIALTPDLNVVAGGVGLVRNGRVKIMAKRDGHDSVNMILRRHPRTLVGTTRNGSLILATVDGRKPGETIGANMVEAAELMRWLGAVQAINLDGGGSTAMVVGNKVVNKPSDGNERAVGDALLVLPKK